MPDEALIALAERLQGVCLGRGVTVGAAESCTGGLIGASITAVAGSSGYFLGSVVAYANPAKEALLAVPPATLEAHGAVSAQAAMAMASGVRDRLGAGLAVSVTGIAGPDGGTPAKPVGLTYIGLAGPSGVEVRRLVLAGDRRAVREAATAAALTWLIEVAEA
jgi:PncC family amidohydrolase